MLPKPFAVLLLAALPAIAAEAPLPGLRIEPTGGGSILFVKNNAAVALAGYLIELVMFPAARFPSGRMRRLRSRLRRRPRSAYR